MKTKDLLRMNLSRVLFHKKKRHAPLPPEEVLRPLDQPFRDALLSMYRREPQLGHDNQRHDLNPIVGISPSQGMWIYQLCRDLKPKETLEIGMAYGFSTVYFLAAIAKNGLGHHTAVDPFQQTDWHGIGVQKVLEVRMESSCRFIEDYSVRASTDLAREGRKFDIIFVDGNHRFDDVLVDFTCCAQLIDVGGHIILDDMWMRSIRTTVSFICTNRSDFAEVRTQIPNISVFRRTSEDLRKWSHFTVFQIGRDT